MSRSVKDALESLEEAAAPWKDLRASVEKVSSAARSVLSSSSLSLQTSTNLQATLRHSFSPLYKRLASLALELAAALFSFVMRQRVIPAREEGGKSKKLDGWEEVAAAIVEGVLDYHEEVEGDATGAKTAIGRALYENVSSFFFDPSARIGPISYSAPLRQSVYTLLAYSAENHVRNAESLRKFIGARQLGQIITSTKDSLPLDEVISLLGPLVPRSKGSPDGPKRRSAFLQECFPAHPEIVALLKDHRLCIWPDKGQKIIDILARDISFPQPFLQKTFHISGLLSQYPKADNRFILDRTSFIFYCEGEQNTYETITVGLDTIQRISVSSSGLVLTDLSSPPVMSKKQLERRPSKDKDGLKMTLKIDGTRSGWLYQTLQNRGLEKRVLWQDTNHVRPVQRFSIAEEPARLDFDAMGKNAFEPSYEARTNIFRLNPARLSDAALEHSSEPGDDIPIDVDMLVSTQDASNHQMKSFTARPGDTASPSSPNLAEPLRTPSPVQSLLPPSADQLLTPPLPRASSPPVVSPLRPTDNFESLDDLSELSELSDGASALEPSRRAIRSTKKQVGASARHRTGKSKSKAALEGSGKTTAAKNATKDANSSAETVANTVKAKSTKRPGVTRRIMDSQDVLAIPQGDKKVRKAVMEEDEDPSPPRRSRRLRLSQENESESIATPSPKNLPIPTTNLRSRPKPKAKASETEGATKDAEVVVKSPSSFSPQGARASFTRPARGSPVVITHADESDSHSAGRLDLSRPVSTIALGVSRKTEKAVEPGAPVLSRVSNVAKNVVDTSSLPPSSPAKGVTSCIEDSIAEATQVADTVSPSSNFRPKPRTRKKADEHGGKMGEAKRKVGSKSAEQAKPRGRTTRAAAAAASKKITEDARTGATVSIPTPARRHPTPPTRQSKSPTLIAANRTNMLFAFCCLNLTSVPGNGTPSDTSTRIPAKAPARKRKREDAGRTVPMTKRPRLAPKTPKTPMSPPVRVHAPTRPLRARKGHASSPLATPVPPVTVVDHVDYDMLPGVDTDGISPSDASGGSAKQSKIAAMQRKAVQNEGKGKKDSLQSVTLASQAPQPLPQAALSPEQEAGRRQQPPRTIHLALHVDSYPSAPGIEDANVVPSEVKAGDLTPLPLLTSGAGADTEHPAAALDPDTLTLNRDFSSPRQSHMPEGRNSRDQRCRGSATQQANSAIGSGPHQASDSAMSTTLPGSEDSSICTDVLGIFEEKACVQDELGSAAYTGQDEEQALFESNKANSTQSNTRVIMRESASEKGNLKDDDLPFFDNLSKLDAKAKGKGRAFPSIAEPISHAVVMGRTIGFALDTEGACHHKVPTGSLSIRLPDEMPSKKFRDSLSPYHEHYSDVTRPVNIGSGGKGASFSPETWLDTASHSKDCDTAATGMVGVTSRKKKSVTFADAKEEDSSEKPVNLPTSLQDQSDPMDHVASILRQIGDAIADKIKKGFDGVDSSVISLRRRFLRQAANDMRTINADYVTTYNELLALEEAYEAFSARKLAAIERAKALADDNVVLVKENLREHDRRAHAVGKRVFAMAPLPESVSKWLS
ncbi:hypothetical protein K488DRAFT_82571 [Vararia minispora EC-137]|uniref:Uncharacterized protein n=1 Tax=Vararia minispora EC-137 TaxID=1314806 RepID=A0ACB8QVT6_9AGAM|nr:hypothetical protein K488DRAFT_82571 [Vararia minispora EC-137]